jgi:hypothetical protein
MKKLQQYWTPTPVKARKIGDAFLILSASLSGAVMGLPLPDNHKLWINFILTLVGVIGKIITNFAAEEPIRSEQP